MSASDTDISILIPVASFTLTTRSCEVLATHGHAKDTVVASHAVVRRCASVLAVVSAMATPNESGANGVSRWTITQGITGTANHFITFGS